MLPLEDRELDTLASPGVDPVYRLLQFHGHWAANDDTRGSEHALDGRTFPLEVCLSSVCLSVCLS